MDLGVNATQRMDEDPSLASTLSIEDTKPINPGDVPFRRSPPLAVCCPRRNQTEWGNVVVISTACTGSCRHLATHARLTELGQSRECNSVSIKCWEPLVAQLVFLAAAPISQMRPQLLVDGIIWQAIAYCHQGNAAKELNREYTADSTRDEEVERTEINENDGKAYPVRPCRESPAPFWGIVGFLEAGMNYQVLARIVYAFILRLERSIESPRRESNMSALTSTYCPHPVAQLGVLEDGGKLPINNTEITLLSSPECAMMPNWSILIARKSRRLHKARVWGY
ncbi:hypothetical protein WOLCODRAFT_16110 [Wolfiporia cocos MD-104 SS10]|uniref:Uncharacterized protein n=1 Tax=Wolfiporia cocos (strain MD-104) TaxID=742152 RepID=A0A2H3JPU6_WOLCO|nr:hypothetical protein WOLCODRAFT_16110 [Wolfiporia cocos MD-104 SS10]